MWINAKSVKKIEKIHEFRQKDRRKMWIPSKDHGKNTNFRIVEKMWISTKNHRDCQDFSAWQNLREYSTGEIYLVWSIFLFVPSSPKNGGKVGGMREFLSLFLLIKITNILKNLRKGRRFSTLCWKTLFREKAFKV